METVTGALAVLLPIIALLLKAWLDGRPERKQEAADEETQQGRRDLESGNADAVTARIDRVLDVPPSSSSGDAGSSSPAGQEGDDGTVRRLATLGISVIKDPGKG